MTKYVCKGLEITSEEALKARDINVEMAAAAWPMTFDISESRDEQYLWIMRGAMAAIINSYRAMDEKVCVNCICDIVRDGIISTAKDKVDVH